MVLPLDSNNPIVASIVVISAKAGIQTENTGFRIKSGMTKCVKLFSRHYSS